MPIFISILASIAAFAGGSIALRFKDKLHIILGLSAGAVIGAALFDLIPEAIELGSTSLNPNQITSLTALGFLIYLVLDRVFSFHSHGENKIINSEHEHIHKNEQIQEISKQDSNHEVSETRGSLGAASFTLHSLIDGIAIGLAFQISQEIGIVVAVAVIAHRFSDGINTVGVILRNYNDNRRAIYWLIAVAIAPLVGTLLASIISVPDQVLASILAIFAGFFLYIGASDLIPEGHHSHSKGLTTLMTIVGALLVYIIVNIAHI